jgi:hypothetical protein
MGNWIKSLIFSILLIPMATSWVSAGFDYEAIAKLPPGEQYRQLSLLMLVSAGVETELLSLLNPIQQNNTDDENGFALKLDDYGTPLARIVDQETMLAGVADMFLYSRQNGAVIQAMLTEIAMNNPILISMVDANQIAEDAIIIRNAIADSLEYSKLGDKETLDERVRAFRVQTIHLRNMMEYNVFQEELALITNEAIVDLGGRLDAYERMFQEEVDPELLQRRIESAEVMNAQTGEHYDEQAMMRTNELLMMLILMESQVRR